MPRFLADENFPGDAVRGMRDRGLDVAWVCEDQSGAADDKVLSRSQAEQRVLLTFDKDFGVLVFRRGVHCSAGVGLFRIKLPSPDWTVAMVLTSLLSRDDWQGMFSVVEPGRVRMSPLPSAHP